MPFWRQAEWVGPCVLSNMWCGARSQMLSRVENEFLHVSVDTSITKRRLKAVSAVGEAWSARWSTLRMLATVRFPSLGKLTVSIILFTRMLLWEQHHIQIWGVHCQVILVEGLTLVDLQSFCSLWVWCSQCANDLATLLSTTHISSCTSSITLYSHEFRFYNCAILSA